MTANINIDSKCVCPAYRAHLFDYTHKFEIYYGGAGSGKSYFIAQKLILKALQSKRKILVIRKVGATLRDSVFQNIVDFLYQIFKGHTDLIKINNIPPKIHLPNGSIFMFRGLDDPEKIKSIASITDIWIEEATELTQNDFTQLVLRVRAKTPNNQIYLSFNPVSKANWVYKQWFDGKDIPSDTFILKTTYKDNPFLPDDYIRSLEDMKQSNPTYFKIYADGDFATLSKLVYYNWSTGVIENTTDGKLCIGLDFGFVNDKTALIASLYFKDSNTLYIFDEYGDTGLTNDKIAKIIRQKGYAKSEIIADSAEPKSIAEIKQHNIYRIRECKKGADSILHGIQKLQQLKIVVNPHCIQTIEELENYSWKKDKDGNYINEPVDLYNHFLDALRYSIQIIDLKPKIKTLSKGAL